MKVVAINSSPMKGEGNTALILDPFLDGMREAGAKVELFYTKNLKVNPCQGDYTCWLKTPGKCIHKDDMKMLLPKLAKADVWVFATPVYFDGISGAMKNVIERMLPLVEPFFELRDNHCRHPRRQGTKSGKVVLVSSCGFWEMDNFDPLLVHMKAICKNADREFAGALLRPHASAMKYMLHEGIPIDDIFAAANKVGRQLVADGAMLPEPLQAVSRNLVTLEQLLQGANHFFQQILNNAKRE
ncbi:MAG: flavodoxin family protein [Desulfobacteraceae bacterium]|jgi:multimeric flavodoxin WrbA